MNDFIETTCDDDYEELDSLPKISYRNSDKKSRAFMTV